jgi:hypothetical protein
VLGPDVALPEAWARGDGPGGILVADWTLCNTPWAGDDHGWTYSDALGSAAASRVDFYGACFRRQLYYRHATDDARVLEVTRGDLPPYDLYDHVVRVHHRRESSDLGSRAGPDDDAALAESWSCTSLSSLDTTAADDGRANARRPLAGSPRSAPKGPALGGYLKAAFDEAPPPPAFGFPKRHAPRPERSAVYAACSAVDCSVSTAACML